MMANRSRTIPDPTPLSFSLLYGLKYARRGPFNVGLVIEDDEHKKVLDIIRGI
jgi:hypothetical protein